MNHVDLGRIALLFLLQVPIGAILGGFIALLSSPLLREIRSLSYPVEKFLARRWSDPSERQVRRGYIGVGAALGVPLQFSLGAIFLFGGNPDARYGGMIGAILLLAVMLLVAAWRVGPPPNGDRLRVGLSWSVLSLFQTITFGYIGWLLFVLSAFWVGVFRLIQ